MFDDKQCLTADGFSWGHEGSGSWASYRMEIETANHTLTVCRSPGVYQLLYGPETDLKQSTFSHDIMLNYSIQHF